MDSRRYDPFYRPAVSKNVGGGGRDNQHQLYDPESPRDSPSPDRFRFSDGRNRNQGHSRLSSGYGPQSYREEPAYSRQYSDSPHSIMMRRSPSPPAGNRYPPAAPSISSPSSRGDFRDQPPPAPSRLQPYRQRDPPTPPPPPTSIQPQQQQHQSFDPFEDFGDMNSPGSRSPSRSWSPHNGRDDEVDQLAPERVPSPPPPPSLSETGKETEPNPLSMLLENKNVSLSSLLEAALEPTGNRRLVGDSMVKTAILERCEAKLAQLRGDNADCFFPYEIESSEDTVNGGGLLDTHPNLEFNSHFDERLVRLRVDGWVPRRLPRIKPPPSPPPSERKVKRRTGSEERDSLRRHQPHRWRSTESWSDDEYDSSSDDHLEELEAEEMILLEEQLVLKTKLEARLPNVTDVKKEIFAKNQETKENEVTEENHATQENPETTEIGNERCDGSEESNAVAVPVTSVSAVDLFNEISDGIRLKYLEEQLQKLKERIKRAQKSMKAKVLRLSRRPREDRDREKYRSKPSNANIKRETPNSKNIKKEKLAIKLETLKKEKEVTPQENIKDETVKNNCEKEQVEPTKQDTGQKSDKRRSRSVSPRNKRKRKEDKRSKSRERKRRVRSRSRERRGDRRNGVRSNSGERKKESIRSKSRERQKDSVRSKSRESQKDSVRSKSRERPKDSVRSKSREREKDLVRSKSRERQKESVRSKSRERYKDSARSKSRERPRDSARSKSRERQKDSVRSKSRERLRDSARSKSRERPKDSVRSRSRERRVISRGKVRSRSKERGDSGPRRLPRSRSRSASLKRSLPKGRIDRIAKKRPRERVSPEKRKGTENVAKRFNNPEIMEKMRKELQEREQRTTELQGRLSGTDFVAEPVLQTRGHLPTQCGPRSSFNSSTQFQGAPLRFIPRGPRPPATQPLNQYQPYNNFQQQTVPSRFNHYNGPSVISERYTSPTEDSTECLLEEAEKKLELAIQRIPLAFPSIMHIQRDNTPLRLLIKSLEETSRIVNRGSDFNRTFILKDQILCVMEGNSGIYKIVVPFDKGQLMIREIHRAYHDLKIVELEKLFVNLFTTIKELMTELNLVLWDCTMCASKSISSSDLEKYSKDVTAALKKISNVLPFITLIQLDDVNLKATIDKVNQQDTPDADSGCLFRSGLLWRVVQVNDKDTVKIMLPENEVRSVIAQIHASYHKMSFKELEKIVSEVFDDNVQDARSEVSFVRLACPECCLKDDWDICSESEKSFMKKTLDESMRLITKIVPFLSRVQREEETLAPIFDFFASNEAEFKDSFTLKRDVLCQIVQEDVWVLKVVVPSGVERQLIQEMHRCYHDLSDTALEGISTRVFHKITDPQIEVNFARFVCETCQREKKAEERCQQRMERDEKLANVMNRLSFDEKKRMESKLEKFMKKTERILSFVQEIQRHDRQLFDIITSLKETEWGIIMMKNDVLCQVIDSTILQFKIVVPKNCEHAIVKRFHEYYHDVTVRKSVKILKKGFYKINKVEEKLKSVCDACPLCKLGSKNGLAATDDGNDDDSESGLVDPVLPPLDETNWIELDAVQDDGDSDGPDLYLSNPNSNALYGLKK